MYFSTEISMVVAAMPFVGLVEAIALFPRSEVCIALENEEIK